MNDPLFDLRGKVVVLTGAEGQLGRVYTKGLVERGARVAALDLRTDEGLDGSVLRVRADVTSRESLVRALAKVAETWETPAGLVNNAALDSPPNSPAEENGPFETYPEASWDRVMEVNSKGPFLCCQVFGGAMAAAGRGSVVNIGSIYGQVSPNQTIYEYRRRRGEVFYKPVAYSASKSSLGNLTRYLATYWARQGVRVNQMVLAGVFNQQDEQFLAEYTAHMPLGRMARAEEYVGGLVFLLSDAASYMTGAELVLDGGWTAW